MRMIVTGGAGFIGSRLVRRAVELGHEVLNIDALTYAASVSSVWDLEEMPNYRLEPADITDRAIMDRLIADHRPDAILHLAAESHVDRSIEGPGVFAQTNMMGTFTLLEGARAYWTRAGQPDDFRFYQVSTDEVFGALGPEGRFTETTAYRPNSPYSATKAAGDHLVRAWHQTYGLPVLTSHASNNYGPGQHPEKFIPKILSRAIAGEAIPVYGSGAQSRDWIHVDDHVDAILTVLEAGRVGECYNIGAGCEFRNIDLARALCRLLQTRRPSHTPYTDLITHVEDRPGHDFRYAIDASKITSELGWTPRYTLEAGLAQTMDWYLTHSAWWTSILERDNRDVMGGGAAAGGWTLRDSGEVAA